MFQNGMERSEEILTTLNRQKSTIAALATVILGILLLFLATISGIPQAASEFLARFGTALIPSGAVAFVYNYALRQTFLKEMRSQLTESIHTEFSRLLEIQEAGLQRVHREFPSDQVAQGFSNAQNNILVFTTWIPNIVPIESAFLNAVKRDCRVKMLLLDPKSDFAKYRGKDLGYTDDEAVGREILANLTELDRFCSKNDISREVEIRLYRDATPTLVFFAYDDTFVFSPYYKRKMGLHTPQIEVRGATSLLVKTLIDHFDGVWETATPYLY